MKLEELQSAGSCTKGVMLGENELERIRKNMEDYSRTFKSEFVEKSIVEEAIPLGILQVKNFDNISMLPVLDDMLQPLLDKLSEKTSFSFNIPSHSKRYQLYNSNLQRYVLKDNMATTLSIGSRRAKGIVFVMLFIRKLLIAGKHSTLRDVYYMDPDLFRNQRECDAIINDISCFLRCSRESLNVLASNKGEVIGNLSYTVEGNMVDCSRLTQVVPVLKGLGGFRSHALFVLVVEKQASFYRLSEDRFSDSIPCILITTKGYLDVNTRNFVKKLSLELQLSVFALMDSDPFDFHIFSVYKCGSETKSYDNAQLATPHIKWLGLLPRDVETYKIPDECGINLTPFDINYCNRLLEEKESLIASDDRMKRELTLMLDAMKRYKIQSFSRIELSFLGHSYLPIKLLDRDWC